MALLLDLGNFQGERTSLNRSTAAGGKGPYQKLAQSFVPDAQWTVDSIALNMIKSNSPTGTLTLTIQADSSGSPSGTPITNGTANTVAESSLPTGFNTFTAFTFSTPPVLTSGVTYWMVVTTDGTPSDVNHTQLSDAPAYASGLAKAEKTGAWETAGADSGATVNDYGIQVNGTAAAAGQTHQMMI